MEFDLHHPRRPPETRCYRGEPWTGKLLGIIFEYFADLTRTKQIAATSTFSFELLIADSILVSSFARPIVTRLLTRGSRCTACITRPTSIRDTACMARVARYRWLG